MVYKNFRTLDDLNVEGKKVLLRIDLNSEIKDGKPCISGRIIEHANTIYELKRKKAKVIVLAHQSRPGKPDFISLKEHCKLLNKHVPIKFILSVIGKKSEIAINKLKNGEAILLENIRTVKDEFKPSVKNKIAIFFKDKIDFYINDAFSVCHRNETSTTTFPKIFPNAMGPVMENELKNIDKIKDKIKGALFILGGNKIDDIKLLMNKKNILPTGILSLLVLKAKGFNLGKKEDRVLKDNYQYLSLVKKNIRNFKIPYDLAFSVNGNRKDVLNKDFPVDAIALDIGKKTTEKYVKEILKAKKIFWKGTAGDCSIKGFCLGTKSLLKAMEKSKAFCVVSGGHSETAVEKYKINKSKLGYVSLSGGALVHYITGKKLPGLEALKIRKKK